MLNLHVVIECLKRKSMLAMLQVFHTVRVTFLHTTVVHPCGPDFLTALDCSSRLLTVFVICDSVWGIAVKENLSLKESIFGNLSRWC